MLVNKHDYCAFDYRHRSATIYANLVVTEANLAVPEAGSLCKLFSHQNVSK